MWCVVCVVWNSAGRQAGRQAGGHSLTHSLTYCGLAGWLAGWLKGGRCVGAAGCPFSQWSLEAQWSLTAVRPLIQSVSQWSLLPPIVHCFYLFNH